MSEAFRSLRTAVSDTTHFQEDTCRLSTAQWVTGQVGTEVSGRAKWAMALTDLSASRS